MIKFKIEENKDSIKNEEEFKDSDLDISININIKPCKSEKLKIGKKYYERIGRKMSIDCLVPGSIQGRVLGQLENCNIINNLIL